MPSYFFECGECIGRYYDLVRYDPQDVYAGVVCPHCGSGRKTKLPTACAAVVFSNPRGTSKGDSFTYVAGYNHEQAKDERRRAEAASHMGDQPYSSIDDISSGLHEDFGKL